jgi:polyhydroxybutyrate depolymerase
MISRDSLVARARQGGAPCLLWVLVLAGCGGSSTAPTPLPASPPAAADRLPPGDHTLTAQVGAVARRYLVHVPPGPALARPAVLAFHGGGGNAAQFKGIAAFDAHADRNGYLVVYPEGTGSGANSWNAGGCCSTAQARQVDDVAFGRAIVADLVARGALDRARLYVTGHSNGAMMAHRFAAEASELVAAAAPYAGSPYFGLLPFAPARPVPLLHIHSVTDPLAVFGGGVSGEGTYKTPVLDQLAYWSGRNGCGAPVVGADSLVGAPGTGNAGQSVAWVRWSGCPPSAPVVLRRLRGAGHAWPGMPVPPALAAQLGPATRLIDIEEEIWQFVSAFRR